MELTTNLLSKKQNLTIGEHIMYEFVGKKHIMYKTNFNIKLNANCPDSEKQSGEHPCSGNTEKNEDTIAKIDSSIALVSKQFNTEYGKVLKNTDSDTQKILGYSWKKIVNNYSKTSPEALEIANKIIKYKQTEDSLYEQRRKLSGPLIIPNDNKKSNIISSKIIGTPFEKSSFDIIDKLPKTQFKSLVTYLTQCDMVNEALFKGNKPSSEVKNMDKIFDKSVLEDNVTIYRGFSKKGFEKIDKTIGNTFSYKGYMSCTTDNDVLESYAQEVNGKMLVAEIHATTGTRAIHIGNKFENDINRDEELELYGNEDETIIDRDTNFKVIDYKEEKDKIVLVIETIPTKLKVKNKK